MAKTKARRGKSRLKSIPLPTEAWKEAFLAHNMRTSFGIALTQPMIEFLCAVADGVCWDRAVYYQQFGRVRPDNWLATSAALEKRGLIIAKSEAEREAERPRREDWAWSNWRLSPAGKALVKLLEVVGLFATADVALLKEKA